MSNGKNLREKNIRVIRAPHKSDLLTTNLKGSPLKHSYDSPMIPCSRTTYTAGSVFLLLLLSTSLLVLPAAARENVSMLITPVPGLNITNYSMGTDGKTGDFVPGPTPITILHVELNQSTLPGPRDMGYGPSIIDLTIAPQFLAVIFIIVLIGLLAWVLWRRKSEKKPDEPDIKE